MEIYKPILFQVFSIIFLLAYFLFSKLKDTVIFKQLVTFFLFLLVLSLFINRDYNANIDLPIYMRFYQMNINLIDVFTATTAWKGDFLFFGIMPIAHLIGLNPEGYITLETSFSIFLTFIAYSRFFKNDKSFVFLALFFMINSSSFYLIQGNVLRQGLASSFLLLSLSCKNNFKINQLKIFSFFIHKGSFFSFFTGFFKISDRKKIILLIAASIIGYFSLFIYLLDLFPLPEFIDLKIKFYSNFERASSNSIIKLVLLILFNILFVLYRSREEKFEFVYRFFYAFSIAALLLFRFDGIFSRLILYTDIFIPILTVGLIEHFDSRKNKLIINCIVILLSLLYSIYVFNHDSILFNMGENFVLF